MEGSRAMHDKGGVRWLQYLNSLGALVVVCVAVSIALLVLMRLPSSSSPSSSSSSSSSSLSSPALEAASNTARDFLRKHGVLVPLRRNLGDSHWAVLSSSALAQRYFDQGLRFVIAYNFKLALENFVQAQLLDPKECAMCAWGEVLCRGQNLNEFPMESEEHLAKAHEALARARDILQRRVITASSAEQASKEAALVEAIALRQQPRRPIAPAERSGLNQDYADAMSKLAQHYPDDLWIVLFACDAQLNTSPWDYWTEQGRKLKPRMQLVANWLKEILQREPLNPAALHYTIHLYEAAADPHLAVEASKRLDGLVPGSEHLLHMPSHGYVRGGLFERAAQVNLIAHRTVPLVEHAYPQHNMEFVVYCELVVGNEEGAVDAAQRLAQISESLMSSGADGYEAIFPYERFVVAPLYVAVVFGRWHWIGEQLSQPPPTRRIYHRALWHWAQAHRLIALHAASKVELVETHMRGLEAARMEMEMEVNVKRYSATLFPARNLMLILKHMLDAALFKGGEDWNHLDSLRKSFEIERAMLYDEPPSQWFCTGVILGENLLQARLYQEAHDVYQEVLAKFPSHPWALYGLARACDELQLDSCKGDAAVHFGQIWKGRSGDSAVAPRQHVVEC